MNEEASLIAKLIAHFGSEESAAAALYAAAYEGGGDPIVLAAGASLNQGWPDAGCERLYDALPSVAAARSEQKARLAAIEAEAAASKVAAEKVAAGTPEARINARIEAAVSKAKATYGLPRDASAIFGSTSFADFGDWPAKVVVTNERLFDGYLGSGDDRYYVGGILGSVDKRTEVIVFRDDWAARLTNLDDETALQDFEDYLGYG